MASQLQAKGEELRTLATEITGVAEIASAEAAQFTATYTPAPVYESVVEKITAVGSRYAEEIGHVAEQLDHDAVALRWLADHHEEVQNEAVNSVNGIDTNLGDHGSSSSPGLTAPTGTSAPGANPYSGPPLRDVDEVSPPDPRAAAQARGQFI